MFNKYFNVFYYQLGLWRIQYLQRQCCVCGLMVSSKLTEHRIICELCHSEAVWLPKVVALSLEDLNNIHNPTSQSRHPLRASLGQIDLQSATYYKSFIRGALIAYKYNEDLSALPILIYALRQLPRPHGHHSQNSVILAVPTTAMRLVKRGFDPLAILAFYLSKHWDIPLWTGVSRVDDVMSQQGLSRQERLQNIRQAFKLTERPPQRRIIIFDDVITTGSTLKEMATLLLRSNYNLKVRAYTLAQAKSRL